MSLITVQLQIELNRKSSLEYKQVVIEVDTLITELTKNLKTYGYVKFDIYDSDGHAVIRLR